MADVMKFRMTVEVMVATHESETHVRRALKAAVREAIDESNTVPPIDQVLDLAVRMKREDEFAHDHAEHGCWKGLNSWSCGRTA